MKASSPSVLTIAIASGVALACVLCVSAANAQSERTGRGHQADRPSSMPYDRNSAKQGVSQIGRGAKTSGRTGTPTGANMSNQQKANLKKLDADITALQADNNVTPEEKAALKNSLIAMADGAVAPDSAAIADLVDTWSAAIADGKLTKQEQRAIAQAAEAVVRSANISEAEVNAAVTAAKNVLMSSNLDKADAQRLVSDLKAIATEAKKNVSAAAGSRKSVSSGQRGRRGR